MGVIVEFWAIVGDGDSRKSSTIRALTGASRRNPAWELALTSGNVISYVEISSVQEGPNPLSPAAFVAQVNQMTQAKYAVVPLIHDAINGQPGAIDYIDHFVNIARWTCRGIALTGIARTVTPFLNFDPSAFQVVPSVHPLAPANEIARQLRSKWAIA